ncbi:transglycosylase SLT domain-containing protein [Agrobacterium rhizogenes]|uniref:Transglycosylase protein n=2 Tax=Rhizobium rhizogenes TaxID=359 RepID=B9JH67_RHIR8|nr:transglycosylase protein [Rhizobium rhizogenes K84]NTF62019.1 transglycosylase SLT domain-containing protein [Rhizobium rhizogenes]OCJ05670.1 transglycosylase [Agrobacterium sp. 13-626]OCJ26119.1 transglycosylase [Agrobacterium sp. B131/95]NTF81655.1 transglycosylase SLT domain-containing protein [Rhizobium rhizogenes]
MVAIGFPSLKRSVAFSAMMCGALAGCASTQQQTSQAGLPSAQTNVPHPNTASTTGAVAPSAGGVAVASAAPATGVQGQPQQQAVLMKSDRIQAGSVGQGQIQAAQDRMGAPAANAPAAANQGTVAIAAATGVPTANTSPAAAYAASDEPPIPAVVAIPMPNPARPGDSALLPVSSSASTAQSTIPMTSDVAAIRSVAVPTPRPDEDAPVMAPAEVAYAAPQQIGALRYADNRMRYDFNFDTSGPTVVSAVLTTPNYESNVPPAEKSYVTKLIQKYAKIYEIPESLIHRVVHRESRYDPKAYNKAGYFGLMQIKYNTAKSMGYEGPASGLLDAETNIKYAAKYLRGAWMVADNKAENKEVKAVQLYARGYYYDAKRKGLTDVANGNY